MERFPREGRDAPIAVFEDVLSRVEKSIEGASPDELRYLPALRDAWSINDFLVHFLDTELLLAYRVRSAIAEPGLAVPAWDEDSWRETLCYGEEDGLACLSIAKGIRAFISTSLRSVLDADWMAFFIIHPTKGRMDLRALLQAYDQHIAYHLPLIRRNRNAWRDRGRR